jgi:DNA-binding NarL/FixJ family response regulator
MPGMKILVLSIYADDEYMAGMIGAGAMGYILKDCESEDLCAAIRRTAGSQST